MWREFSLIAVDDAATREIVRRELHHNFVLGKDPDVVLAHLAADVGEHFMTIGQLDLEHRIGKRFDYSAFHFDNAFFFRHNLFYRRIILGRQFRYRAAKHTAIDACRVVSCALRPSPGHPTVLTIVNHWDTQIPKPDGPTSYSTSRPIPQANRAASIRAGRKVTGPLPERMRID